MHDKTTGDQVTLTAALERHDSTWPLQRVKWPVHSVKRGGGLYGGRVLDKMDKTVTPSEIWPQFTGGRWREGHSRWG